MEKAILKTLAYSDIFDYPLKMWEIHKWLILKKADFIQVEKAINRLVQKKEIQTFKSFYFLPGRKKLVGKRLGKEKHSRWNLLKIRWIGKSLSMIPWVKLVGVSGSLAMDNSTKFDDIDLFLITSKNRLWLTRLLILTMLDLMGVRRKFEMSKKDSGGKVCVNLLLEEDQLLQSTRDLYTAHEVLQMKVLFQRSGAYFKFLADNEWVFNFLPNWTTNGATYQKLIKRNRLSVKQNSSAQVLENLSRIFQLKIMHHKKGQEVILPNALYFHPENHRIEVLKAYQLKIKSLI